MIDDDIRGQRLSTPRAHSGTAQLRGGIAVSRRLVTLLANLPRSGRGSQDPAVNERTGGSEPTSRSQMHETLQA